MEMATFPHNHSHWWLFHTGHYISRIHMDADGSGTMVVIAPGGGEFAGKLWIVGRRKTDDAEVSGTMGIPVEYDPAGSNTTLYDFEAVWLRGNDRM